jgi:hypothetical protein
MYSDRSLGDMPRRLVPSGGVGSRIGVSSPCSSLTNGSSHLSSGSMKSSESSTPMAVSDAFIMLSAQSGSLVPNCFFANSHHDLPCVAP